MFKDYRRLVVFDTETSGLSPDNGEILELGAVVLTRPEGEENSHRALDDVKATLKVMRAFWKEKNDIEKYIRRYNEGI